MYLFQKPTLLVLRPVYLKELSKGHHYQNLLNAYIKSEYEGTWESAL